MVRSLCELEWAKEKGGDAVRSTRRRASNGAPKEKKEGGSGTGTRARIESRHGCRDQRGVQCDKTRRVRHNAVVTRERHTWAPPQTASTGYAVTATRRM
jgi:hypothetical protein